jgi:hypothetical protein
MCKPILSGFNRFIYRNEGAGAILGPKLPISIRCSAARNGFKPKVPVRLEAYPEIYVWLL